MSIGRREPAIATYIRGFHSVVGSHYSYMKRWDYLLAIVDCYIADLYDPNAGTIDDGKEIALCILNKLLSDTEEMKDLEGAEECHRIALSKKSLLA